MDGRGFYYEQRAHTKLGCWGNLKSSLRTVVRDNGKNIIKALDDAGLRGLPCVAHTLQLVANEGRLAQRSVAHAEAVERKIIITHFKHHFRSWPEKWAVDPFCLVCAFLLSLCCIDSWPKTPAMAAKMIEAVKWHFSDMEKTCPTTVLDFKQLLFVLSVAIAKRNKLTADQWW